MDKRIGVAIAALGVTAFVLLGVWGYSEHTARGKAEAALTGNYQRAFYATLDNVQNVHVLLGKAKVAGSKNQLVDLWTQMRGQAWAAQENLTQVPVPAAMAASTAKFLTQVGDFAGTMLSRAASGKLPDGSQQQTMASLYTQSGELNSQLRAAEARTGGGKLYLSSLPGPSGSPSGAPGGNAATQDLATVDTQMQKYPGLIYDGPFADTPARGKAGPGGSPTPTNQVGTIALKFLDPLPGVQYQSKFNSSVKGALPSYRVQVSPVNSAADSTATVDVAATGSQVAWFLDSRPVNSSKWNVDQAQAKAISFLAARGLSSFVPTYHRLTNNQAIFSLVREDGGVKIYPQQVKVAVALDNGQVVGFEGTDYLLDRGLQPGNKVVLSAGQAQRLIKNTVATGTGVLSVIPDGRGGELYAYEFSGRQYGATYLLYINAANGAEQQILRVVDIPGGQLTL